MLKKLIQPTVNNFCFFNKQISEKYGKKCCRYNQDGKPLPYDKVQNIYSSLHTFLNGWKIQQQGTRLTKYYYTQDYPLVIKFLQQVIKIDAFEFKQCPSFHVTGGQMLKLQLYSVTLNGLSMLDFQLAMRINNLQISQFQLLQIQDEKNYRKQVGKIRMKRESQRIQKQLDEEMKQWKK